MATRRLALIGLALPVALGAGCDRSGEEGGTASSAPPAAASVRPPGASLWAKRFGDAAVTGEIAVAVDGEGNILVTGTLTGPVDFGGGSLKQASAAPGDAGPGDAAAAGDEEDADDKAKAKDDEDKDIFVAKLDPAGRHLWSKRFGGQGEDLGGGLGVDTVGSLYLTGQLTGAVELEGVKPEGPAGGGKARAFVAKLDPDGKPLWARSFAGAVRAAGTAIAVTGRGESVTVGEFAGERIDFGGDSDTGAQCFSAGKCTNLFAVKLDGAGKRVYGTAFRCTGRHAMVGGVVIDDGQAVLAGSFTGALDFGGGPLVNADGSRATSDPQERPYDIFVAKLDASGNHLFSKRFGGPRSQRCRGVGVDRRHNLTVAGTFSGSISFGGGELVARDRDIFVAQLDASGSHKLSHQLGAESDDGADTVAVAPQGDVVLAGHYHGKLQLGDRTVIAGDEQQDLFVAQLDQRGAPKWGRNLGGRGIAAGSTRLVITLDKDGAPILFGRYQGSLQIDKAALTGHGSTDLVLAKLIP